MSVNKHQTREDFAPLPQCQAYTHSGYQCKKNAVEGKKVCRQHGGLSLSGIAHPQFEHGRRSKYIPSKLIEKYNEAQNDKDLLSLSEEIKLIDARINQLLERVEEGGGMTNWSSLNKAWRGLIAAQRVQDQDKASELAATMNDIINRGLHDSMIWSDIEHTIDRRQRLVSAEAKRLTDMEQMITTERALGLMVFIAESIRTRLMEYMDKNKPVDRKLLNSISTDIYSKMGHE